MDDHPAAAWSDPLIDPILLKAPRRRVSPEVPRAMDPSDRRTNWKEIAPSNEVHVEAEMRMALSEAITDNVPGTSAAAAAADDPANPWGEAAPRTVDHTTFIETEAAPLPPVQHVGGISSLMHQYRTGTGWFGPMVPPETAAMSEAEREQAAFNTALGTL